MNHPSFSTFDFSNGLLHSLGENSPNVHDRPYPTNVFGYNAKAGDASQHYTLGLDSSFFIFVYEGTLIIQADGDAIPPVMLRDGMYGLFPYTVSLTGQGKAVLIESIGYSGLFSVGGPIEHSGRLKYIDGCTDSLLIAPVKLGNPCFNHLHFPPGIYQTQHTHPSVRIGVVARGHGDCITPTGNIPLYPGQVFIIHAEGVHSFCTYTESMDVIAFHPDSDFGPTDEDHPMINRTIVDGVSANQIDSIRTK
jgi:quercetin dioxygenase-like cupin family protein